MAIYLSNRVYSIAYWYRLSRYFTIRFFLLRSLSIATFRITHWFFHLLLCHKANSSIEVMPIKTLANSIHLNHYHRVMVCGRSMYNRKAIFPLIACFVCVCVEGVRSNFSQKHEILCVQKDTFEWIQLGRCICSHTHTHTYMHIHIHRHNMPRNSSLHEFPRQHICTSTIELRQNSRKHFWITMVIALEHIRTLQIVALCLYIGKIAIQYEIIPMRIGSLHKLLH